MMPLELSPWSLLTFAACAVIVVRLLTFRRGRSRHRPSLAWASWLMIAGATAMAVKIAAGLRPPPGPLEALAAVVLAVLLLIHRGDLAHLLRLIVRRVAK